MLFRVSHYYYTLLGTILTLIAAYIVSLFTAEDNPVKPELVSPLVRRFIPKERKPSMYEVEYKVVDTQLNIVSDDKM